MRKIPTVVKDKQLVNKRRRQIADAAVRLFFENGFHKTTTRQIAASAGVSIGTLYEYVQSKEDVLYLVCQAIHGEIEQRLQDRLSHQATGSGALDAAMRVYFAICHEMRDHVLLIYQETKSLPRESMRYVLEHELRVTDTFAGLLQRGSQDYTLRPLRAPEIKLMAHNIMVMGHMWAFRRWALSDIGLDEYTDMQTSLIMGQLR